MGRDAGRPKTCNRCGRTGSHAFRRMPDGLYECTTVTACRARARRQTGGRQDGRGRLARQVSIGAAGPGVAYVIGPEGPERDQIGDELRQATDLSVAYGDACKSTLAALGSRNVKLIALSVDCLDGVGFRNELSLRRRQPRLSAVPVLLYGPSRALGTAGGRLPDARPIPVDAGADARGALRRQLAQFEAASPADGAPV